MQANKLSIRMLSGELLGNLPRGQPLIHRIDYARDIPLHLSLPGMSFVLVKADYEVEAHINPLVLRRGILSVDN